MTTDDPTGDAQSLEAQITHYLASGGFFNPEMMDHDKVRDLLIACRDELAEAPQQLAACQAERDKWLEAFNKSEQFQNGPTKRAERLADQAREISVLLSEAGCNAMPIPEAVRRLVNERDALAAQIATLRAKLAELVRQMRSERSRYKSYDLGFVDSVSASNVDDWADEIEGNYIHDSRT